MCVSQKTLNLWWLWVQQKVLILTVESKKKKKEFSCFLIFPPNPGIKRRKRIIGEKKEDEEGQRQEGRGKKKEQGERKTKQRNRIAKGKKSERTKYSRIFETNFRENIDIIFCCQSHIHADVSASIPWGST